MRLAAREDEPTSLFNDKGMIVATIMEDYAIVRRLMSDLLATALEVKLCEQIADMVAAVKEICRS